MANKNHFTYTFFNHTCDEPGRLQNAKNQVIWSSLLIVRKLVTGINHPTKVH